MSLYSKHYLQHYGVKGMKWGVRRYQNEDGTLTAAGKERYYNDDEQRSMYENARKSTVVEDKYIGRAMVKDIDDVSEAGAFLKKQSESITKDFEDYSERQRKDLVALKTNSEFMGAVRKRLNEELGGPDMVDDDELLDLCISDAVVDLHYKYSSKETGKAYVRFQDNVFQYMDNVKSITDDIVGQYGDRPVASFTQTSGRGLFKKNESRDISYRDAVENTLAKLGNSSWVRYLNNHQEMADYDTDEWHDLERAIKEDWKKSGK